jgi:hypothetical protein
MRMLGSVAAGLDRGHDAAREAHYYPGVSSVPRDHFVSAVVHTLAPYVGQNMANAAVKLQLEKLGGRGPLLTLELVEQILAELSPALHVFLGRSRTQTALDEVRGALQMAREEPA